MAGRGRPDPAPQADKRAEFAGLISRGVSSSEACRIVGVNVRTESAGDTGAQSTGGGRWIHYPAVINTRRREISSRYLSEDERVAIADLRRAGQGYGRSRF